jgi:hypothetical protein
MHARAAVPRAALHDRPADAVTRRRRSARGPVLTRALVGIIVLALGILAGAAMTGTANAADNPFQRGPDPTTTTIAATRGPFATTQTTVAKGNGFGGGVIYYPTDTSQGTFAALAVAPGFGTEWRWYGWLGERLASFGFVVFGIETNTLNDSVDARGTQLLAALDWLQSSNSPVRTRVDANRLAVAGHSAGGGGAFTAALRRPTLLTAIGMAPAVPGSLSGIKMPAVLFGGQTDGTVTPSYLANAYATIPSSIERAYIEIANEGHGFPAGGGGGNSGVFARTMMLWMKLFMDKDTRYSQFLCPALYSTAGISKYQASCPLDPPGGITPSPSSSTPPVPTTTPPTTTTTPPTTSTTPPTTTTSPPPVSGACQANYRTVGSWPGAYQGEVTVTAGTAAVNGWTVSWPAGSGPGITQIWSGTLQSGGSAVSVKNAAYNGSLTASASTTFGFIANGAAPNVAPSCTSP